MPTITSIKPQKNQKRVNIYLDDKFGFGVDLENYVKLGLKVGQNYTNEEIAKIVRKSEFQKSLNYLIKFASLRPRSKGEIDSWYKKRKVPESITQELNLRLEKLELVDDEKFATWWVGQRLEFKPKSKRALVAELGNKKVDKATITKVLEKAVVNEENQAKQILMRRMQRWVNYKPNEVYKKSLSFLSSRGYGFDVIRKVFDDLGIKRYNLREDEYE